MADIRTYRSFTNRQQSQPIEEATHPMNDEQTHAIEVIEASENPGALTADATEAREDLADAAARGLECDDPGDEDGAADAAPIGDPPLTEEGETLT